MLTSTSAFNCFWCPQTKKLVYLDIDSAIICKQHILPNLFDHSWSTLCNNQRGVFMFFSCVVCFFFLGGKEEEVEGLK